MGTSGVAKKYGQPTGSPFSIKNKEKSSEMKRHEEEVELGMDLIQILNWEARENAYNETQFWKDRFGTNVADLWDEMVEARRDKLIARKIKNCTRIK